MILFIIFCTNITIMAKAKKRADKYEKPLAVKGTFRDLIKLSVSNIEVKNGAITNSVKRDKK